MQSNSTAQSLLFNPEGNPDSMSKNDFNDPTKLSVIIITKNEEKNISRCLSSLEKIADEIVVVDSGSTDKTCDIVRSFPRTILIETEWKGYVENKKIAVNHASHSWILWIDADEEVTEALCQEWKTLACQQSFLEKGGAADLARKTFFMNHWVKHSGWYPGRVARFFHKERANFSESILHESIQVKDGYTCEHLQEDLLHHSYPTLFLYFEKMNKYGEYGAREIVRKKRNVFFFQVVFQPLWTFVRFYILKKGFLDGKIGFIVCAGAAFSNFIKYVNAFFLKKYGYISLHEEKIKTSIESQKNS